MMTRKSTAVFIALAALTLAGFFIVSNVITGRMRADKAPPPNPATAPTATPKPQVKASPQSSTNKMNTTEAQLLADLAQAQALLDQLNAEVVAGAWDKANGHFAEFEQKTRLLPAPQLNHPDISPVMQDFFALYKLQLSRALSQQDAQQSRFAANQLFGIVSEQRARFGTRGVPLEFQRLYFLIREVEIWNHAGDQQMAQIRANSLRDAWKDVRPVIIAKRNGLDQAKSFDLLIEKLSAFDQIQDMPALISNLGKGFEQMNMLFQRATRQPDPNGNGGKSTEDD
ncbi:MAG: hypothetical protein JMDDDDMK_00804 [Acidobacteria bacterium]|nr:hypothetical protein [Acidobacteriota bacterium]